MNHEGMQTDAGILELIRDRLNIDVVDVDVDLIETGMVDSLALVTLISRPRGECSRASSRSTTSTSRTSARRAGSPGTSMPRECSTPGVRRETGATVSGIRALRSDDSPAVCALTITTRLPAAWVS